MVEDAADIFGDDIGAQRPTRVEIAEHHREIRHVREHARLVIIMLAPIDEVAVDAHRNLAVDRSEEHTSELQSLMRISYAVFCLKKKKHIIPKLIKYINTKEKNTQHTERHIQQ